MTLTYCLPVNVIREAIKGTIGLKMWRGSEMTGIPKAEWLIEVISHETWSLGTKRCLYLEKQF